VAYWEAGAGGSCGEGSQGVDRRIIYVTPDARLFSLNAVNGKPCKSFGMNGSIDLRQGVATEWPKLKYDLTSPPVVYGNLIIIGSEVQEQPSKGPSGAARAFDARTGKLVWQFDTVPKPGEIGNETWAGDSWKDRSGTNAWGPLSVDLRNSLVFLPVGSPTYDFYGADRKGTNLFANSVVALDARTGKRLWHFQTVHHDLWDYDLPAGPKLLTIRHNGKNVDVVIQPSKQGFLYVLDRVTGQPIWPMEERPVPKSDVPGEESWPTQPFPTKPPPFARQTLTENDINPYIPAEEQALTRDRIRNARNGGLFTPPSFQGTVEIPGSNGGASWGTAAVDPVKGTLYIVSHDQPNILILVPPDSPLAKGAPGTTSAESRGGKPAPTPPRSREPKAHYSRTMLDRIRVLYRPLLVCRAFRRRGFR
jgi:quinoprotein glucose dehydrogenase